MLLSLFRRARSRNVSRGLPSRRFSFVPRVTLLEDRLVPSTLTVTNLSDTGVAGDGSLRGEIAAAAPGDTISFAPKLTGTIGLTSDLTIDRNLTILGNRDAAGNALVTLSRGEAQGGTDLVVNAGITAWVSGLTFTGGNEHALLNHGSLTLDHVAVSGNQIGYYVGFLPYQFNGTINNDGTLVVQNSRITNNTVNLLYLGPADVSGGGAGIWNTGALTVADSTIADNVSPAGNTNVSVSYGGGIVNWGGTATITGCTITGNRASEAGGIYASGRGSLTLSSSTISGNSTIDDGGGIQVLNCAASITDCTISGNSASNNGGGIEFLYTITNTQFPATLTQCTVANNTASSYGGGICVLRDGLVTIADSTITGNAANKGAGIYAVAATQLMGATLTLLSSTVAGNQASGAGGGLYISAPLGSATKASLTDTLIANNSAPGGGPDVSGTVLATSAYNLIGNGDGSTGLANGTNGNLVGTTASPIDPRLGPLTNNGGPTATMALLPGSPAFDAGSSANAPQYDQRGPGYSRVVGSAIDIGAFEVQPAGVMTHFGITAPASAVAGTPSPITFQALDDLGNPAPGYVGPVHLTVTDGQAVLTQDYTLTGADAGAHSSSVTLTTAGVQVVTVTANTPGGPLTLQGSLIVSPAAAASLRLSAPAATTAGQAVSVTVTMLDAYGNVVTGYTGTVHFTSSDAKAALPANYAFTSADAGTRTFSVTLKTAGTRSITAANTLTSSLTATAAGIVVSPAAAAKFVLAAPASVTHGMAFSLTLTVQDAYGNVATGYTGAVHFTSSDGTAILPGNYTFTATDAGVHTFTNALVLRKRGTQTIAVTDVVDSTLTATAVINVL
jgi:hypothetical protein